MVSQDEQRTSAFSAEDEAERALRHVNPANWRAVAAVNENLSVGDVHVAVRVDGDTLAAPVGEGQQIA